MSEVGERGREENELIRRKIRARKRKGKGGGGRGGGGGGGLRERSGMITGEQKQLCALMYTSDGEEADRLADGWTDRQTNGWTVSG